jgi:hypothetical protein
MLCSAIALRHLFTPYSLLTMPEPEGPNAEKGEKTAEDRRREREAEEQKKGKPQAPAK